MQVSKGTKFNFLNPEEQERYQKHLTLEEIGIESQLKLKKSSVLCIGAGGLGSSVMLYLAAAGIGKIGIVDNDIVERAQNGIVRQLESSGESEISSDLIGELVMNALGQIDHVAYIRYASVYRNFREASDFGKFVKDEFEN